MNFKEILRKKNIPPSLAFSGLALISTACGEVQATKNTLEPNLEPPRISASAQVTETLIQQNNNPTLLEVFLNNCILGKSDYVWRVSIITSNFVLPAQIPIDENGSLVVTNDLQVIPLSPDRDRLRPGTEEENVNWHFKEKDGSEISLKIEYLGHSKEVLVLGYFMDCPKKDLPKD